MTRAEWIFLIGGLLSLNVTGGNCLQCWKCTSSGSGPCASFSNDLHPFILEQCPEDEVCFKHVLLHEYRLRNGTHVVERRVKRGCTKYKPDDYFNEWTSGDCIFMDPVSPPFAGIKCWCNTDYCNGSVSYRRPNGYSHFWMLLSLLFVNYLQS